MLAILLVFMAGLARGFEQAGAAEVIPVASASRSANLLADTLAGRRATGDVIQVAKDNLRELVADKAAIYREYRVISAASRQYGAVRADVFQTQDQFAAFGLFLFNTGPGKERSGEEQIWSGAARIDRDIVFWKGNFFVRVSDKSSTRGGYTVQETLARRIADAIVPAGTAVTYPPLLDSLPAAQILPESKRYFLGPESLNDHVEHGREMFLFEGDTEAVIACYNQDPAPGPQSEPKPAAAQSAGEDSPLLKLVIVEYHTPQFATDAMARVTDYVSSLPEAERGRIIIRRTGNYVIEATNVRDREFAEGLIGSVSYPYTVKWLRNPLWPTNDPFRTQKAAEMLLSTFGLLGLILMTVVVVGSVFGTTVFLKRRKRQKELFSDAGGMLRLDIDQFESVILGLPPKRED